MHLFSRSVRAFTLVELLITLTIFATVSVISVTLLVNGLRSAKKIQAQVLLYSEAQSLMDQIARDVERSTVDYEAYFARNVLGETGWDTLEYGAYAQSFFDPGSDGFYGGPYPDSIFYEDELYGTLCSGSSGEYPEDCPGEDPMVATQDVDDGLHPFSGYFDLTGKSEDPGVMNAFCRGADGEGDIACDSGTVGFTNELILVNAAGDERTVYALELLDGSTTEYGLSRVRLLGSDTDTDGIENKWGVNDSSALSPLTIQVLSFDVLVTPTEDPYRAFGEADAQIQPQVMIVMTLSLSSEFSSGLLGEVPTITLQRSISTGVYSKVESY